jgi:hypothetical protein
MQLISALLKKSHKPVIVAPTKPDKSSCNNPDNTKFTLTEAKDAVAQFCSGIIVLPDTAVQITRNFIYDTVKIQLGIQWSQDGQTQCGMVTNPDGRLQRAINKDQCSAFLLKAVNNCKSS